MRHREELLPRMNYGAMHKPHYVFGGGDEGLEKSFNGLLCNLVDENGYSWPSGLLDDKSKLRLLSKPNGDVIYVTKAKLLLTALEFEACEKQLTSFWESIDLNRATGAFEASWLESDDKDTHHINLSDFPQGKDDSYLKVIYDGSKVVAVVIVDSGNISIFSHCNLQVNADVNVDSLSITCDGDVSLSSGLYVRDKMTVYCDNLYMNGNARGLALKRTCPQMSLYCKQECNLAGVIDCDSLEVKAFTLVNNASVDAKESVNIITDALDNYGMLYAGSGLKMLSTYLTNNRGARIVCDNSIQAIGSKFEQHGEIDAAELTIASRNANFSGTTTARDKTFIHALHDLKVEEDADFKFAGEVIQLGGWSYCFDGKFSYKSDDDKLSNGVIFSSNTLLDLGGEIVVDGAPLILKSDYVMHLRGEITVTDLTGKAMTLISAPLVSQSGSLQSMEDIFIQAKRFQLDGAMIGRKISVDVEDLAQSGHMVAVKAIYLKADNYHMLSGSTVSEHIMIQAENKIQLARGSRVCAKNFIAKCRKFIHEAELMAKKNIYIEASQYIYYQGITKAPVQSYVAPIFVALGNLEADVMSITSLLSFHCGMRKVGNFNRSSLLSISFATTVPAALQALTLSSLAITGFNMGLIAVPYLISASKMLIPFIQVGMNIIMRGISGYNMVAQIREQYLNADFDSTADTLKFIAALQQGLALVAYSAVTGLSIYGMVKHLVHPNSHHAPQKPEIPVPEVFQELQQALDNIVGTKALSLIRKIAGLVESEVSTLLSALSDESTVDLLRIDGGYSFGYGSNNTSIAALDVRRGATLTRSNYSLFTFDASAMLSIAGSNNTGLLLADASIKNNLLGSNSSRYIAQLYLPDLLSMLGLGLLAIGKGADYVIDKLTHFLDTMRLPAAQDATTTQDDEKTLQHRQDTINELYQKFKETYSPLLSGLIQNYLLPTSHDNWSITASKIIVVGNHNFDGSTVDTRTYHHLGGGRVNFNGGSVQIHKADIAADTEFSNTVIIIKHAHIAPGGKLGINRSQIDLGQIDVDSIAENPDEKTIGNTGRLQINGSQGRIESITTSGHQTIIAIAASELDIDKVLIDEGSALGEDGVVLRIKDETVLGSKSVNNSFEHIDHSDYGVESDIYYFHSALEGDTASFAEGSRLATDSTLFSLDNLKIYGSASFDKSYIKADRLDGGHSTKINLSESELDVLSIIMPSGSKLTAHKSWIRGDIKNSTRQYTSHNQYGLEFVPIYSAGQLSFVSDREIAEMPSTIISSVDYQFETSKEGAMLRVNGLNVTSGVCLRSQGDIVVADSARVGINGKAIFEAEHDVNFEKHSQISSVGLTYIHAKHQVHGQATAITAGADLVVIGDDGVYFSVYLWDETFTETKHSFLGLHNRTTKTTITHVDKSQLVAGNRLILQSGNGDIVCVGTVLASKHDGVIHARGLVGLYDVQTQIKQTQTSSLVGVPYSRRQQDVTVTTPTVQYSGEGNLAVVSDEGEVNLEGAVQITNKTLTIKGKNVHLSRAIEDHVIRQDSIGVSVDISGIPLSAQQTLWDADPLYSTWQSLMSADNAIAQVTSALNVGIQATNFASQIFSGMANKQVFQEALGRYGLNPGSMTIGWHIGYQHMKVHYQTLGPGKQSAARIVIIADEGIYANNAWEFDSDDVTLIAKHVEVNGASLESSMHGQNYGVTIYTTITGQPVGVEISVSGQSMHATTHVAAHLNPTKLHIEAEEFIGRSLQVDAEHISGHVDRLSLVSEQDSYDSEAWGGSIATTGSFSAYYSSEHARTVKMSSYIRANDSSELHVGSALAVGADIGSIASDQTKSIPLYDYRSGWSAGVSGSLPINTANSAGRTSEGLAQLPFSSTSVSVSRTDYAAWHGESLQVIRDDDWHVSADIPWINTEGFRGMQDNLSQIFSKPVQSNDMQLATEDPYQAEQYANIWDSLAQTATAETTTESSEEERGAASSSQQVMMTEDRAHTTSGDLHDAISTTSSTHSVLHEHGYIAEFGRIGRLLQGTDLWLSYREIANSPDKWEEIKHQISSIVSSNVSGRTAGLAAAEVAPFCGPAEPVCFVGAYAALYYAGSKGADMAWDRSHRKTKSSALSSSKLSQQRHYQPGFWQREIIPFVSTVDEPREQLIFSSKN